MSILSDNDSNNIILIDYNIKFYNINNNFYWY